MRKGREDYRSLVEISNSEVAKLREVSNDIYDASLKLKENFNITNANIMSHFADLKRSLVAVIDLRERCNKFSAEYLRHKHTQGSFGGVLENCNAKRDASQSTEV